MESAESRYAHLLQPIRELTKNWEIDLASELNDYLEELDDMCIIFDGGKTRLNFAEAALLIQSSACIYSKKVELLHGLVFQTLEYINDKNKKRNKQGVESQDSNGQAASSHDADDMDEFSTLDLEVSDRSKRCDSNTAVNVIPLPPESLIAPETHEKQKLLLISVKGEILCSQKDFKINLFLPGEGDMILLTLRSTAPRFLLHSDPTQSEIRHADAVAPVDAAVGGADAEDGGGDAADDFLPIEVQNMEQEEHVERLQTAPSDGRMIRERRQLEADKPRREDQIPPAVNVWAFHDPYAVLREDKPLKPGKCYRVPDGLDEGGKRKRKRAASLQDFRSWFRGTFDPPEHKLKNGPTFTDLNYVYLSTVKVKLKTQKRINRRAGVMISDEELRRTFLQPEEAGPHQVGAELVEELRQDLLGGDNTSDNEHEAFPDDIPAEFLGGPDLIFPEAQRDQLSYEDLVKLRVEQLVVNSRGYNQETALSQRVKEWEEKIRPELALQEERPVFDIHDYGDRIMRALSGVGCRRSFASIVHGLDNFEASKYLLASLQLANDYTVEIDSSAGLEDGLDTMGLTLLSTHRATDRFHTLTASA
ncbi:condensin-2 complex subunit H2 [Archocentrus centrarchus]|uniref:condensin-2 complex subunit H2 n=1 Tax=Archocentrus centrarchus TaxID=63155 RepID=UPI0011EA3BAA|nr:condensin-2 complex subunit H2 [Archocentrus centrarchus]XP_030576513.1 condensin-2 complex subunit H2 [Archocentrus centrarchus]